MNLDWHRLKAVVLESDDWGLCAWVPDDRAHRALALLPAFRTAAGLRYGRSTLERAHEVTALADLLRGLRGGDGYRPVWQANTIVANPDYGALEPPLFPVATLPLRFVPEFPARWARPGLWDAVRAAEAEGVWWAELHGLHHLPETTWLNALRRGQNDARRALEHESPLCLAVEASGEYDPSEPREVRARDLRRAIDAFRALFGRMPTSFCPPDYRFDEWFAAEAASLGLTTFQGRAEQAAPRLWQILRRRWAGLQFPDLAGDRFNLPPRIAFEPGGDASAPGPRGLEAALRKTREAWQHGQPAILSTHRMNYAHLDEPWSERSRTALRELLTRLCADGAVFLTDHEVRQLVQHNTSWRPLGGRGVLLRHYGVPREELRHPVPEGVTGALLRGGPGDAKAEVAVVEGELRARVNVGEFVVEWTHA